MRNIYFADLNIDLAHGPVRRGRNAPIVTIILQPYKHKDKGTRPTKRQKKNKKRVVGFFRHQNCFRCTTSTLAMNLFYRLNGPEADNIKFVKLPSDGDLSPNWQRIPLIRGWASERAVTTCFTRILRDASVKWKKKSHMRCQANRKNGSFFVPNLSFFPE